MASALGHVVMEVHSFDHTGSFGNFSAMAEQMAAKCRSMLGKSATLRNDTSKADVMITALYFRCEPTGIHQEVEIAWLEDDGAHRIIVDECFLNIQQASDIEPGFEPSDVLGEVATLPTEIWPSNCDTVEVAPLALLSSAVTEYVKLGSAISEMAKNALPVGTRVEHKSFGEGTVSEHTEHAEGMVFVMFDDEKYENKIEGAYLVRVADLSINLIYLDQNHIPF